jgi:acyl transferase domain-containing protein
MELFATNLLDRFGIRPTRVAGHSYGEHVALHVAGCLSRDDLLRLSASRGRACAEAAQACAGAMASVQAGAEATAAALKELGIPAHPANLNAPDQTVIAGPVEVIEAALAQLPGRGLRVRRLPVSAAFHTPLLTAASEAMEHHLGRLPFARPQMPVYSNTTGELHSEDPAVIRRLLAQHFREPVLFEKQVRQMYADGMRLFLEVGPGKVLTDLVSRILAGQPAVALALDPPGRAGWTQLAHTLARLVVLGLPVRLDSWFRGRDLAQESVGEFLARVKSESTPRPTAWVLSPNKAEPVTPPQCPKQADSPLPPSSPPIVIGNHHAHGAFHPASVQEKPEADMTTNTIDHTGNGQVSQPLVSDHGLFDQLQATTRALLASQRAQSKVLLRFLETQERLLHYCTGGIPAATCSAPASRQPSTSTAANSRSDGVSAGPAPAVLAPRVRPAPASVRPPVPVLPATPPPERPAPLPARSEATRPATPVTAATNGDGPPSTEQFRKDLLEAVSTRTGYPVDALDEGLALEAALGIDSIKTVEIFSNLKAYHPYFRAEGQEEEELLAEFSKFKTLRDIIQAYDRRRQAHSEVKRYSVAAVPAPAESEGAKKN